MINPKLQGQSLGYGSVVYNGNKTCAVVDGNNFCIRSYFTCSGNPPTPEEFIGQTFKMFINLMQRHDFDFIIFTFDGGTEWRTQVINENMDNWIGKSAKLGYKGKRVLHTTQDYQIVKKYMLVFQEYVLKSLGVPVYKVPGIEADDLIYWICKYLIGVNKVVISADEDLVQCCKHPNSYWLAPQKKIVLSKYNFEDFNGYPLERYLDLKSICGDSSDNIEGVYGLSSKTLEKWHKRSNVYPWDLQNWLKEFGTEKEKEKFLTPRVLTNHTISKQVMDLEAFTAIWSGLDLREFYGRLVLSIEVDYGLIYRIMKATRVKSIAPTVLRDIEKTLKNCFQTIQQLKDSGIWG